MIDIKGGRGVSKSRRILAIVVRRVRGTRYRGPEIDLRASLDGAFRFLQMLVITGLVSILAGIFGIGAQLLATALLSFAAGCYALQPIAHCLAGFSKNRRIRAKSTSWMFAGIASLSFTAHYAPAIVALFMATVHIDVEKARLDYNLAREREEMLLCARASAYGTYDRLEPCLASVKRRYHPTPLPRASRLND